MPLPKLDTDNMPMASTAQLGPEGEAAQDDVFQNQTVTQVLGEDDPSTDAGNEKLPAEPKRGDVAEAKPAVRMFAGVPMAPAKSVKTPNINTLLYGRPGSGKTFLTATAELCKFMAPMLYVSCEAGSSTVRQVAPDIMILPDPEVRGSVTWEEFEAVYDELDRQCYNSKDLPDFRTVAVDTGTELQKINMNWVMGQTLKDHPDRDPDVPGLHDWGKSTNRMRSTIRRFRDLPLNFIFVCHEQEERDNRGLLWKKPDLPGKLANQAAAFFDQVMYLYTKQVSEGSETAATDIKRVLMTGALEGYVTKDRSGYLPLLMVDPNMTDIFNLITTGHK